MHPVAGPGWPGTLAAATAALVGDLVAALHYMYTREYWAHKSHMVYRHGEWNFPVPPQRIEFGLLFMAARKPVTSECFWRLFLGTVVMLAFGCAGGTGFFQAWVGFFLGMVGWTYIEGITSAPCSSPLSTTACGTSQGFAGCTLKTLQQSSTCSWASSIAVDETLLNVVCNFAEFVNKIAFVRACWSAAKS